MNVIYIADWKAKKAHSASVDLKIKVMSLQASISRINQLMEELRTQK